MLYNFLLVIYVMIGLILIPLILMQKSKSSMGIGSMGGGSQVLFGGSGGQDMFQKTTWVLGALFVAGTLALAIMKTHQHSAAQYMGHAAIYQPFTLPSAGEVQA